MQQTAPHPDFDKGFLMNDRWMAGVSSVSGGWLAYVLNFETGELAGGHLFETKKAAVIALGRITSGWSFETLGESCSGCGESCPGLERGHCSRCKNSKTEIQTAVNPVAPSNINAER